MYEKNLIIKWLDTLINYPYTLINRSGDLICVCELNSDYFYIDIETDDDIHNIIEFKKSDFYDFISANL